MGCGEVELQPEGDLLGHLGFLVHEVQLFEPGVPGGDGRVKGVEIAFFVGSHGSLLRRLQLGVVVLAFADVDLHFLLGVDEEQTLFHLVDHLAHLHQHSLATHEACAFKAAQFVANFHGAVERHHA